MAKKRVSDLPAAGTITGAEQVPVVQGGASKRASLSDIVNTLAPAPDLSSRQPLNGNLTAISGLSTLADRVSYWTGAGAAALTTFTAFGRSLVGAADAAAAKALLSISDSVSALWSTPPTKPSIGSGTLLATTGSTNGRSDTTRGFELHVNGTGAANDRQVMQYRSQPGTNWTYTTLLSSATIIGNYRGFGIAVRASSTGGITSFNVGGALSRAWRIMNWTNIDTYATDVLVRYGVLAHGPVWLRVVRAGSTFSFLVSLDGELWTKLWSGSIGTANTDQVGVILSINDSGFSAAEIGTHYLHCMSETLV